MEHIIELPGGVKFEVLKNGYALVARDGERVMLDTNGKLLHNLCYKKDNLYWLKYFKKIGQEERQIVYKWYVDQQNKSGKQLEFINRVGSALELINYDYRISTLEPYVDPFGRLCFEEGKPICNFISFYDWEIKAKEFAPKYDTDLATLEELYIWYAYRVAMGYWTIEYVCEDSSSNGNYFNSPKASHMIEVAGAREVGGYKDGIGNTFKIVKGNYYYKVCGGYFCSGGKDKPVANFSYCFCPNTVAYASSGVIVTRKESGG